MNVSAKELRQRARVSLQGNFGNAVLACLIVTAIVSAISGIGSAGISFRSIVSMMNQETESGSFSMTFSPFGSLFSVLGTLLSLVFSVGLADYFIHLADCRDARFERIFNPFRNLGSVLPAVLLTWLYIFLWSLLFVIPGIIAAYRYAMVPYIMAEHPETKPKDAIELSKKMMEGNCGKLFCLHLSFIGWGILCIFTLFIGFIFLEPYMEAAGAEFFNEVSGKNYLRGVQGGAPYGDPAAGYGQSYPSPVQPDPNAGYQPYQPPVQPDPNTSYQPYQPPVQPDPNTSYQPYQALAQPDGDDQLS